MANPLREITPEGRVERWKKMWGNPKLLDDDATETAFDEFVEQFVPVRMQRQFAKLFGTPKAQFGNRCFAEDSQHHNWDTKLSDFAELDDHTEVIVIYGAPDRNEAHSLRGDRRRSLKDIVIDDWHPACAIVRARSANLYVFVENKMRGCIVRVVQNSDEEE